MATLTEALTRYTDLTDADAQHFADWYMATAKNAQTHNFTAVALEVADEFENAEYNGCTPDFELTEHETQTGQTELYYF